MAIDLWETKMTRITYKRHLSPPAVIQHAVRLCLRFTLNFCDVDEVFPHQRVDVSYETVRAWTMNFISVTPLSSRRNAQ